MSTRGTNACDFSDVLLVPFNRTVIKPQHEHNLAALVWMVFYTPKGQGRFSEHFYNSLKIKGSTQL